MNLSNKKTWHCCQAMKISSKNKKAYSKNERSKLQIVKYYERFRPMQNNIST